MADQIYSLIFEGNIAEGHNAAEVKKNLASLLKKDIEEIELLFSGKPVVIKKDMTRATAEKCRNAFLRAGALCRIEPADPFELIHCPSCRYKQRQAKICLRCGAVLNSEAVESVEAGMIHCPACKYKQRRGEKCINCGVDIQGFKTNQMRRKLRQKKLSGDEMILTNIETIPGWEIVEHYGLVSGNTIRAKHIGKDFLASVKNFFGGELTAYTQLFQESRDEAVERMKSQARDLGANAIVNIRFSTSSVAQGSAELHAYGTAVRIE